MTEPVTALADDASVGGPGYERDAGQPRQSRSVTVATHGMAATSQPLAAQAGIDILRSGGNAVDAAIAVNAMLGVVEPMSCGIGGDLFVIYWDAKTKKLYGLNASGRSPHSLHRQVFAERKLEKIPDEGPLCWSTPGCVSGWQTLQKRFGKQTFAESLAPAIAAAEDGFAVSEVIAGYWKAAVKGLRKYPDSAKTFLPEDQAPRFGQVFRNPQLAATYRTLASEGADAFYRGSIAQQIAEFSEKNGGFLTLRDLNEHTDDWVEPVSTDYRGYTVWELPPNGQGIAALQMLNVLEGYDVSAMGPGSPEYLHLFVEAKKQAFADRAKFYADPAFADLPTAELISKPYAEKRRALIDRHQAAANLSAGDPQLQRGDTVYLTVVDDERNVCSMIQSNYYGFGSKMTPGELGFVLQNRGALFSLDPEHLNTLEPHKRPFHTIIPAMVTKDNRPWLSFGVMGGDMQPQGHVQVLVNLIDFKMNIQQAGDAARVRHFGGNTPTHDRKDGVGTVAVEAGISNQTIAELRKKGHTVMRARGGFGGYQAILIDWENGVLHGATEPRKDGAAVGY